MSTNELLGRGRRGRRGERRESGERSQRRIGSNGSNWLSGTFQFPLLRLIVFTSVSPLAPHSAPPPPPPHASTSPPPSSPSVSVTHKRCLNLCHLSSACFLSVLLLLFLCHSVRSVCSTGLMSGLPLIGRARSAGRDERMIAAGRWQTLNGFI